MLNVETNHQHTGKAAFYFLLQAFIIVRIVAVAQHAGHCQLLRFILNDVDSAKSNHAAEEGRVFLWLNIILVDDTERSLVAVPDGINLVASQSTVEIQLSLMIDITDGYAVGVCVSFP